MSLKPSPIGPVPGETARVARAAFRKGNPLLKLRDELGAVFADADFADLFPKRGQPGLAPWRLALVTLLQFREDLADRRAAEAVRARIDRKYVLGLELTAQGGIAQVSTNVEDHRAVPLADLVAAVARHAPVAACELVGLAPEAAFAGFPPDVPVRGRRTVEEALHGLSS